MTKQELNYAFDNCILDETQIALDIEMSKRRERLKAHPYDVWQGKDGKWRTYLPEPRSKTGRVQRVRNTREEIEEIISDCQVAVFKIILLLWANRMLVAPFYSHILSYQIGVAKRTKKWFLILFTDGNIILGEEITERERIMKNSYDLVHIGINGDTPKEGTDLATRLCEAFNLSAKQGQKSVFAGSIFECMQMPFLGSKGHIALATEDLDAAVDELKSKGFSFRMDTATYDDDGRMKNIYLEEEFGGFAIHILRK